MTGPMQVLGRGRLSLEERVALERDYVETISLTGDVRILLRTIGSVLGRPGRDVSLAGARVAIVHDWLQGMHGSERTVEAMITTAFSDAERCDVFTFHAAHDILSPTLSAAVVREAAVARLPGSPPARPRPGPLAAAGAVHDAVVRAPGARWLRRRGVLVACVRRRRAPAPARACCTPATATRRSATCGSARSTAGGRRGIQHAALEALVGRMRRQDLRSAARPRGHIAISTAVAERIRSAYGRDAPVVHPPVEVGEFAPGGERDPDHFVWVHRLTPYKRPLEVVEAFRAMPSLRLTMVGVGPLADRVRAALPPNVTLRDWISRAELADLLASAGGFVHVGVEDFGITMVEALASGTPVLAVDRGGALDIVSDGVTGVLISDAGPPAIRAGVQRLRSTSWDHAALSASAQRFSRERFAGELRERLAELASAA